MNVVAAGHLSRSGIAGSRIVAFSTGNVYPLVPASGGRLARDRPGRDRSVSTRSRASGASACSSTSPRRATRRSAIVRLNYAIALRYGVLTDLALKVVRGEPIPLAMGHVNVIWQGDANRCSAASCCRSRRARRSSLNVTGPEHTLGARRLPRRSACATRRAEPTLRGHRSAGRAALEQREDARRCSVIPSSMSHSMLDWTADWVGASGRCSAARRTSKRATAGSDEPHDDQRARTAQVGRRHSGASARAHAESHARRTAAARAHPLLPGLAGAGGIAVGVHTTQFAIRDPRHGLYRPVLALAAETVRASLVRTPRPFVMVAGSVGHDGAGGGRGGDRKGARLRHRAARALRRSRTRPTPRSSGTAGPSPR